MEKQYFTLGEGQTKLWFDESTPAGVAEAIHWAYVNRRNSGRAGGQIRIRVWYGDPETGRAWLEEHDVIGYVGRSTGRIKIPLLVYNSRSMGGGALLTSHIVKIAVARKGHRVLYEHPDFDPGLYRVGGQSSEDGRIPCWHKFQDTPRALVAHFDTWDQAERYTGFMVGRRFTK